ncbi:hypothetical protein B0I32_14143 [Nonomuraea fuscirosea]|uniref:Uncharacterized protein n=1 Tax=Nonomuraea fuscirosea TaxID=1291556 RepID=A0A2T0LVX8_9ACTN|nr:hypothetical protein [Nonomuraea fuscirosea]PRX48087.1 hypothetical protein B0I32_14143 [Nonomuraea fuscirosea]
MAPLERTLKTLMEIVIGLDGRCRNWPACPPPSTPHTPTRTSHRSTAASAPTRPPPTGPTSPRAEGSGWSLIGALSADPMAFMLLDTAPETLHPARGTHTTTLLHSLANIARAQHDSAATGLEDRE